MPTAEQALAPAAAAVPPVLALLPASTGGGIDTRLQSVAMSEIQVDPALSALFPESAPLLAILRHAIKQGDPIPPLTLGRIANNPDLFLVDGHHRRAALEAEHVPTAECVVNNYGSAQEMLLSSVALNADRRHLTTSQRAAIGASLATLKPGRRADKPAKLPVLPLTQALAAEKMRVSERSVRDAVALRDRSPGRFQMVLDGRCTLAKALSEYRKPAAKPQSTELPQDGHLATAKQLLKQLRTLPSQPFLLPSTVNLEAWIVRRRARTNTTQTRPPVGIEVATQALAFLDQIPPADPQLSEALTKVRDWCVSRLAHPGVEIVEAGEIDRAQRPPTRRQTTHTEA